jgi:hypothetical protein
MAWLAGKASQCLAWLEVMAREWLTWLAGN